MPKEDVCDAPMAVLGALIAGDAGWDGCTCSANAGASAARIDPAAAKAVLGDAGTAEIIAAQGVDYLWGLSLSGGVPLTCPGTSVDTYNLYPTISRESLPICKRSNIPPNACQESRQPMSPGTFKCARCLG